MTKLILNQFKLSETTSIKIGIINNASFSFDGNSSNKKLNNVHCLFAKKTFIVKMFYSLRVGTLFVMNYISKKSLKFTGVKAAMALQASSGLTTLIATKNSWLRPLAMNFTSQHSIIFFISL